MTVSLLAALQLPDSCRLGKRVFKKLFLENAKLTPQDRRAFTDDVEEVVWEYTLKPSTIAIMPYSDEEREYDEIAVLRVSMRISKNAFRIAEVIHRSIPYPLVLVLCHANQQMLSLAPKRLSRSERGATVIEDVVSTGWMRPALPNPSEGAFIAAIALANLPQASYLVLYASLIDRVLALRSACRTGEYHVLGDRDWQTRQRRLLAEADDLEKQIAECRTTLRKETQFNRRVEVSTTIRQLEDRLIAVVSDLRTSKNGA